jgi:hypothetical protein
MLINDELTQAFNQKPRVDINSIKKMSPGQLDSVKTYGSGAENLLKNKDFALFVHHFKFDLANELSEIKGHADEDNHKRISIAHNLSGIDKFVASLHKAVYFKNSAVSIQSPAAKENLDE